MTLLSDRDLALLHTKFIVPVVVGQILRGDDVLDETAEYALNTVIGDLAPDTALLCLALCAQRVEVYCRDVSAARMLGAEANRIVEDYGTLWLLKEKGTASPDEKAARRILDFVPEDLEAMAHLLDATLAQIGNHGQDAARICDLLAIQAHEKMEQAESMDLNRMSRPGSTRAGASGNVVPFPVRN